MTTDNVSFPREIGVPRALGTPNGQAGPGVIEAGAQYIPPIAAATCLQEWRPGLAVKILNE